MSSAEWSRPWGMRRHEADAPALATVANANAAAARRRRAGPGGHDRPGRGPPPAKHPSRS
jgi:hypothetical protein